MRIACQSRAFTTPVQARAERVSLLPTFMTRMKVRKVPQEARSARQETNPQRMGSTSCFAHVAGWPTPTEGRVRHRWQAAHRRGPDSSQPHSVSAYISEAKRTRTATHRSKASPAISLLQHVRQPSSYQSFYEFYLNLVHFIGSANNVTIAARHRPRLITTWPGTCATVSRHPRFAATGRASCWRESGFSQHLPRESRARRRQDPHHCR